MDFENTTVKPFCTIFILFTYLAVLALELRAFTLSHSLRQSFL
jgi:hypothetical protein